MKTNKFNMNLCIPKIKSEDTTDCQSQPSNQVKLEKLSEEDHLVVSTGEKKLEEILQWFQERNIKQGNPEDLKDDILDKAYSGKMNQLTPLTQNTPAPQSKPKNPLRLKMLSKENFLLSL